MKKCKCERCGRIRDLFQYTYFDVNRKEVTLQVVKDNGSSHNPQFTVHNEYKTYDESRGLCEECAVEVNKAAFDKKQSEPFSSLQ